MGAQAQISLKGSRRLGSYLRQLRTGYGYSLRRVEERARAEGGEIDNSQLSRYEKGICYPSFDKLRVLASVFNVSIQSFSDVVELEAIEHLKPESDDPQEMILEGDQALRRGASSRAFVCYERALELLASAPARSDETIASVRVYSAIALRRMGKLSLAEKELRIALRSAERLCPELRTRAVLTLASIHAHQGERFLSELEAGRAYDIARAESLDRFAAMALQTLSLVLSEQGRYEEALQRSREAAEIHIRCEEHHEAIRVRINIGSFYVALGKHREGIRLLQTALAEARRGQKHRLEALAWSALGEAYYRLEDKSRARGCFRESNALADSNDERQADILFYNAYYDWKLAIQSKNPTRCKIAFGRLKALRSSLERRFPEVEAFDEVVERGQVHAQ